jgi:radical SAM superfamily enzyme YgiQ (UPF0313 family)
MKKSLLLIQPENPRIRRFRHGQLNNFVQLTMPYLAGFVDEARYDITLVDEYNQTVPLHRHFDLACLTVNTPNVPHCYDLAAKLRQNGAAVAMGGPHVTLLPAEAAPHCDHLLVGEGEETWPQFLQDFYVGSAQKVYEPQNPPCLVALPHPQWNLLKNRISFLKGAAISTRGCPHHCRYCNLKQIYAEGFRTRPTGEVAAELAALRSKFFVFWDDNFFANRQHALGVMAAITPLKKHWAAQVTLKDCKDEHLLAAAHKAGCLYLFVGLESFSEESLREAGKGFNPLEEYASIIERIHRHKLLVQAGVVFGFDHDGPDVFTATLNACNKLGIDGAPASILTPLPKTPIYEQMRRENRLLTTDWTMYDGKTAVAFAPKNMSAEELYSGYMWFRRHFYGPHSLWRRMWASKTRPIYNLGINVGYGLALRI